MTIYSRPCWLRCVGLWTGLTGLFGATLLMSGCESNQPVATTPVTPPSVVTGPPVFHGTIGSLTRVQGTEPQVVSGFGFVVGLNGTGSSEVPAYLRSWLTSTLRRQGVGDPQRGLQGVSADGLLRDPNTTAVRLQGLIPPGAVKGSRFDLLVNAVDTQTTSLEGGKLLVPFDLAIDGANPAMRFSRPLARGDGHLYLDPLDESASQGDRFVFARQAVILGGGRVLQDRELFLVLNQPSAARSRIISDRINERFRHERATELFNTARPLSESLIQINIPARFANQPLELLELINKLYVQRAEGFETTQAQQVLQWLMADPTTPNARDAAIAWFGLGAPIIPMLRAEVYQHENQIIRMAGLEAGARIGDELVTDQLVPLTRSPDSSLRMQCAQILVYLPRSLRGNNALKTLLDDDDVTVRTSAYESLAAMNDPMIQRRLIGSAQDVKFILDLVPASKPLIYIAQEPYPTIALFDPNLGFTEPTLGRVWDNRLMVRSNAESPRLTVYFQSRTSAQGQTFEIAPMVANLLFLLGHQPTEDNRTPGLDLTYSQIITVLHALDRQNQLAAPLFLRTSRLVQDLEQSQLQSAGSAARPEVSPPDANTPNPSPEPSPDAATPATTPPPNTPPDRPTLPSW